MNGWLIAAGLSSWKPILTALLLPPTPFLLLLLFALGFGIVKHRWRAAAAAIGVSTLSIWISSCSACGDLLARTLLPTCEALTPEHIARLRGEAGGRGAIIVLGGGVEEWAPEYDSSNLMFRSLERLRYGVWLAGHTRWPVGFSGGVGWGQPDGAAGVSEASVGQRIAIEELRMPLRWVESKSRDTRENAINTVALLRRDHISRVLLVTHYWHMPRALRNFRQAAGTAMTIEAAPMGMASHQESSALRWLPSGEGLTLSRQVIRERLGLWSGA